MRYCFYVPDQLPALYQLGIVGAGQMARLIYQAALKFGITPRLLAEGIEDSAAQAAPDAYFAHPDTLAALAEYCEVLTFEHDRLDLGLLQMLERNGTVVRPGIKVMRAAFDKLHQRRVLSNRNFPVPPFVEAQSPDDLFDFASEHGFPLVLKSARSGPPGTRNLWIVDTRSEMLRVSAEQGDRKILVEAHQDILKELVVLVARRPGGSSRSYPVIETVMRNGTCTEVHYPADVGPRVAAEAQAIATRVADELDAVGILAVEFFLSTDGLMINEIAARPHNAGHPTIEAGPTSQFENHVRAVLDLPLGPTWTSCPAAVTINVIGGIGGVDPANHLPTALAIEGAQIHLYGKRPLPGRKLGHVTAIADDIEQARDLARRAEAALQGSRL